MSYIIATQFSTQVKLLRGDLPKSGAEMTTSMGSNELPSVVPLPMVSRPRRPPPGLPVPAQFRKLEALPANHGSGDFAKIGDVVTQLSASIVGCHREPVMRETGLENCPSSNLHNFVPQVPHSRHELIPPSIKSTENRGNIYHTNTRFF